MNPFSIVNLIKFGAIAGVIGIIVWSVMGFVGHYHKMERDSASLAACSAVAGGTATGSIQALCPAGISASVVDGLKSRACNDGLGLGEAGAFAVRSACSTDVKRVVASVDALTAEVSNRDGVISQLKSDRNRDVAKAEARGAAQAKVYANANKAIETAPRDPGGGIVCDADCLRNIWGQAPAPGPVH